MLKEMTYESQLTQFSHQQLPNMWQVSSTLPSVIGMHAVWSRFDRVYVQENTTSQGSVNLCRTCLCSVCGPSVQRDPLVMRQCWGHWHPLLSGLWITSVSSGDMLSLTWRQRTKATPCWPWWDFPALQPSSQTQPPVWERPGCSAGWGSSEGRAQLVPSPAGSLRSLMGRRPARSCCSSSLPSGMMELILFVCVPLVEIMQSSSGASTKSFPPRPATPNSQTTPLSQVPTRHYNLDKCALS